VSENDNRQCAGTTNVAVSHGKQRLKRKTLENRHRECGRDMLGQTVPSKYRQQQQRRPDRRRRTAVYDGHLATVKQIEIGRGLELIGEVRRYCPVYTLVHKNTEGRQELSLKILS